MADTKENKKKIKVTSVTDTRKAGQSVVTQFKGEDGVVYEAWGEELAAVLKVGEELECDILHTTKTYQGVEQDIHRVQQVYIDGKPVRPPRAGAGGGGRNYGKSDEQVRIERISIEGQTAYNGVIELIKSGKSEGWEKQVTTAKAFAEKKMRDGMNPPSPAAPAEMKAPPTETKAETTAKTPQETKSTKTTTAQEEASAKADAQPITASLKAQITQLATNKEYSEPLLSAILIRQFAKSTLEELTQGQAKELMTWMQEGKYLDTETAKGLFKD